MWGQEDVEVAEGFTSSCQTVGATQQEPRCVFPLVGGVRGGADLFGIRFQSLATADAVQTSSRSVDLQQQFVSPRPLKQTAKSRQTHGGQAGSAHNPVCLTPNPSGPDLDLLRSSGEEEGGTLGTALLSVGRTNGEKNGTTAAAIAPYRSGRVHFLNLGPQRRVTNKAETKYLDLWASDRKKVSLEGALGEKDHYRK